MIAQGLSTHGATLSGDPSDQPVLAGWLKLPRPELVFDIQQLSVQPGCRRDAGEFVWAILQELVRGGYTIYLRKSFIEDEIDYYRIYEKDESPTEMVRRIVACLESAKGSGVLDWDCFRKIQPPPGQVLTENRHMPWMSPPGDPNRVRLESASGSPLPVLRLSVRWDAKEYKGGAGIIWGPRPGSSWRHGLGFSGERKLWNFGAGLTLKSEDRVIFEKLYPQEPWKTNYNSTNMPVPTASLRILEDIRTGLKFAWPEEPARKDKGKRKSI